GDDDEGNAALFKQPGGDVAKGLFVGGREEVGLIAEECALGGARGEANVGDCGDGEECRQKHDGAKVQGHGGEYNRASRALSVAEAFVTDTKKPRTSMRSSPFDSLRRSVASCLRASVPPLLNPLIRQPAFRVDGGLAAHAGGGDGLAVGGVGDVAGGEDAVDVGQRAMRHGQADVTLVVKF